MNSTIITLSLIQSLSCTHMTCQKLVSNYKRHWHPHSLCSPKRHPSIVMYTWLQFILIKGLKSVPERVQDYLVYRVLQGVERHPMEPHRAPLGGEGLVCMVGTRLVRGMQQRVTNLSMVMIQRYQ